MMSVILSFADLFTVIPTSCPSPPPAPHPPTPLSFLVLSLLKLLVLSRFPQGWFVFLSEVEILVTFRPGIDSLHLFDKCLSTF